MILAIDCGSTNHKAGLFDRQLQRLASASVPLEYSVRTRARVEFDPERYWQSTVALIRQVCAKAGVNPRVINTVSITSQAQTFTLLDESGRAMLPFLSWADKRAQAESRELTERFGTSFHRHCSFPSFLPQLQIAKLLWLRRRQFPGGWPLHTKIVSAPAFLALRLAGVHCIDKNLAAMSGLFSLAHNGWWTDTLSACSIEPADCGALVEIGAAVEACAPCAELDLSPRLRVVFAGNDQTAGDFANRSDVSKIIVTLGTALVAYRFASHAPGPFSPEGCWGPYPNGGYYELRTRDEGCSALDWAVSQLTPGNEARFFQLATRGRRGACRFDPQLIRSPNAWSCPAVLEDMAIAVLEGICFSVRDLVKAIGPATQHPSVTVIGGGSGSDFWLELLADVLQRDLRRGTGDNLLGAAMMVAS